MLHFFSPAEWKMIVEYGATSNKLSTPIPLSYNRLSITLAENEHLIVANLIVAVDQPGQVSFAWVDLLGYMMETHRIDLLQYSVPLFTPISAFTYDDVYRYVYMEEPLLLFIPPVILPPLEFERKKQYLVRTTIFKHIPRLQVGTLSENDILNAYNVASTEDVTRTRAFFNRHTSWAHTLLFLISCLTRDMMTRMPVEDNLAFGQNSDVTTRAINFSTFMSSYLETLVYSLVQLTVTVENQFVDQTMAATNMLEMNRLMSGLVNNDLRMQMEYESDVIWPRSTVKMRSGTASQPDTITRIPPDAASAAREWNGDGAMSGGNPFSRMYSRGGPPPRSPGMPYGASKLSKMVYASPVIGNYVSGRERKRGALAEMTENARRLVAYSDVISKQISKYAMYYLQDGKYNDNMTMVQDRYLIKNIVRMLLVQSAEPVARLFGRYALTPSTLRKGGPVILDTTRGMFLMQVMIASMVKIKFRDLLCSVLADRDGVPPAQKFQSLPAEKQSIFNAWYMFHDRNVYGVDMCDRMILGPAEKLRTALAPILQRYMLLDTASSPNMVSRWTMVFQRNDVVNDAFAFYDAFLARINSIFEGGRQARLERSVSAGV
jgi:hypothetical protein